MEVADTHGHSVAHTQHYLLISINIMTQIDKEMRSHKQKKMDFLTFKSIGG